MTATFYVGDAIKVMNTLPEKSVDLVLASPPFLALRSYLPADHPDKALEGGSQSTPGEFIDWLLDVVEACARVLAPHGSLVFELGDTYSGSGGAGGDYAENGLREGQPTFRQVGSREHRPEREGTGADGGARQVPVSGGRGWPLAKSLSLIPESFRWAMVYGHNPFTGRQTEPWRLRNVIRWVRPNPPVGALGDKVRPATSELMVFCKSKTRFFDLDAIRRPHKSDPEKFTGNGYEKGRPEGLGVGTISEPGNPAGAPPNDWYEMDEDAPLDYLVLPPGGYPGSHYAVWPKGLLIDPIKSMTPERVCRTCGEPSRRITQTEYVEVPSRPLRDDDARRYGSIDGKRHNDHRATEQLTLGWTDCGCRITCATCEGEGRIFDGGTHAEWGTCPTCKGEGTVPNWRPGLVLDPFGGSGTTALVATGHGRDCILIDIDARNVALARDRIGSLFFEEGHVGQTSRSDTPLLAEGGAAK